MGGSKIDPSYDLRLWSRARRVSRPAQPQSCPRPPAPSKEQALRRGQVVQAEPPTRRGEPIEVRESTRVVLGDIPKNECGVLLTLVCCFPRSLRDLPLKLPSSNTDPDLY